MSKVAANNFLSGAITSDKLETSVATNLASANSANATAVSALSTAQAVYNSANTNSTSVSSLPPVISSVTITDASWTPLDDTAANTGGGYCVVTGTGFVSGATVTFGTTSASAVTYANSTSLRVQVPSLAATSYPVYVVNPNGATAIKVNGLTSSSFPAWGTNSTLANTISNTAFSVSLSANSDSSITYSNTTALPAGTTLASNGYFYGTVSIGEQTTYSFDVKATDAEYQDASRTFSLTVTLGGPPQAIWTTGISGISSTTYRSSPVQVGTLTSWSKFFVWTNIHAYIKTDGSLWMQGLNAAGSLGKNDVVLRSSPVQVGALTNWSDVKIIYGNGSPSVLALKTDGTLWSWGSSGASGAIGALGQNDLVARSSPTQIGTDTNWSKLASNVDSSSSNFAAIKTNGTLWMWGGADNVGSLGLNIRVDYRSSPTQVGADTNWNSIVCGGKSTIATKTNGTLWMWGNNLYGNLGLNISGSTAHRSSPVQIGTDTNWSMVANGYYVSTAVKTNGTLWTWGRNTYGTLADSTAIAAHRSSPVQIGALTNWSLISTNTYHTGAIKTDGTLWVWGRNTFGQLGDNTVINRSSPIQIGAGTTWTSVHAGLQTISAMKP